jgi:flagellar hook-basal body complex protein FliE
MSHLPIDFINSTSPLIKNKLDEIKVVNQGPGFGEVLQNAIQEVSELQNQAGQATQQVMTGEIKDIHSAMIAVQKADISFQMMMQVRNKIVSAYQEIMKMQV